MNPTQEQKGTKSPGEKWNAENPQQQNIFRIALGDPQHPLLHYMTRGDLPGQFLQAGLESTLTRIPFFLFGESLLSLPIAIKGKGTPRTPCCTNRTSKMCPESLPGTSPSSARCTHRLPPAPSKTGGRKEPVQSALSPLCRPKRSLGWFGWRTRQFWTGTQGTEVQSLNQGKEGAALLK